MGRGRPDSPRCLRSLKEPAGGSNTSALPCEDRNNGRPPPNPIPGLRGGDGWARTLFPHGAPLGSSTFPGTRSEDLPPPLTAWGGSLQGADQGGGAQRCSDLPRPCKRLAVTSGPPLPDPGFPALGGGWREGEWSQKPQRRARSGVTGAQKKAQSEALSTLPADPALPTPRPPPHPPDSVCLSLHPLSSLFLSSRPP